MTNAMAKIQSDPNIFSKEDRAAAIGRVESVFGERKAALAKTYGLKPVTEKNGVSDDELMAFLNESMPD